MLKTNREKLEMIVAYSSVLLDYARGDLDVPQSTIDYIYQMQTTDEEKEYISVAKSIYRWSKED